MAKNRLSQFGRQPPKYGTSEELAKKIEEYFESGIRYKTIVVGPANNRKEIIVKTPTICDLCLYLGFESRQSFYAYEKNEEFCYTIKKARLMIEREYEEQLQTGNPTGAIFALKNFDWKDTQGIEHSGLPETHIHITNIKQIIEQANKENIRLKEVIEDKAE